MLQPYTYEDPSPSLGEREHLNIADASTRTPIPVAGVEAWGGEFLQAQTLVNAPLSFTNLGSTFGTPSTTSLLDCRRCSQIVLRVTFSALSGTALIRPLYADAADKRSIGNMVGFTASQNQDNGRYLAPLILVPTLGAYGFGCVIEDISGGNLEIGMAGI